MSLFADLLGFYGQFGFEPLPELSVTYGAGIGLHGSVSRFVKDRDMPFLWTAPTVQWDARVTGECMVVVMDLDAGGRRAGGAEAGPIGPYVHAMWVHCTGDTLKSCKQIIPYVPPGVSSGTNRYVFLQLRQPPSKTLRAVDHTAHFGKWDFGRFLSENFPAAKGACADDAEWTNFSGKTCADYNAEWCGDGGFHVGAEWTAGERFNWPERACCACGKPAAAADAPYSGTALAYNFMYVSGSVEESNSFVAY